MKPPKSVSRRQLVLCLEGENKHLTAEQTREEIVQALAELLLEALGEEVDESTDAQGGANEPEDHQ
jgi:hypothetical protein